jgi:ABC-type proline/glycine betaine transport system ATPase subunit
LLMMRDQAATICFTTHDHATAHRLADNVLWLDRGKLSDHTAQLHGAPLDRPGREAA